MQNTHNLKGRLDLLPSLDALLATRSVTAAAERMHVTQPAMSRTLEQLRNQFDDPLLVRVGAEMQLTHLAESLIAPLRQILFAAQDLYTTTTFEPLRANREFNVIIPDVIAIHLLPRLLKIFTQEAPNCKLRLIPWNNVESKNLQLDMLISSEIEGFPNFIKQPLFRDHDVLVYPADICKPKDLFALNYVAVIPAGLTEDPVDRWLRSKDKTRQIHTTVPHYLLAMHLVASAGLAAIMPLRMVEKLAPGLALEYTDLPLQQEPDQQWLLYPPQYKTDSASQWLREKVLSIYSE